MKILMIISIISTTASIIFLYLFFSTNSKLNKLKNKFIDQNKQVDEIKNSLNSLSRNGYFKDSINLISEKNRGKNLPGDKYEVIIYVKEIDRFTTGMSKIKLIDLEIVEGYDINQYEWIKKVMRSKFSSIKKTSDIEWIESENDIKEMRKQKLEKLEQLF